MPRDIHRSKAFTCSFSLTSTGTFKSCCSDFMASGLVPAETLRFFGGCVDILSTSTGPNGFFPQSKPLKLPWAMKPICTKNHCSPVRAPDAHLRIKFRTKMIPIHPLLSDKPSTMLSSPMTVWTAFVHPATTNTTIHPLPSVSFDMSKAITSQNHSAQNMGIKTIMFQGKWFNTSDSSQ